MENILRRLLPVAVCLFGAAAAYAQGTEPSGSTSAAYASAPSMPGPAVGTPAIDNAADSKSAAAIATPAVAPPDKSQAWRWVHAGVALQVAGNLADVATSWKQPEGNSWLTQSSGPYAGKFYTSGALKKTLLSVCLASASYAIAYKWPKTRRLVGIFNMTVGAGFAAEAANNLAQNPNLR